MKSLILFLILLACSQSLLAANPMPSDWNKDILPENFMPDERNDFLFYSIFVFVVLTLAFLFISNSVVLDRHFREYVLPIWLFVIGMIAIVLSQYLVFLPMQDNLLFLRITQWLWQLLVALSIWKLVKDLKFNFKQVLFASLLLSLFIHGLKVFIRYTFYNTSIFYSLDRLLYGSLLVFLTAIGAWLAHAILKDKKMLKKP